MTAVAGVLIDTSVWVDHFRHHNGALVALLGLDMAWTHIERDSARPADRRQP